jgi:hypothetical protein
MSGNNIHFWPKIVEIMDVFRKDLAFVNNELAEIVVFSFVKWNEPPSITDWLRRDIKLNIINTQSSTFPLIDSYRRHSTVTWPRAPRSQAKCTRSPEDYDWWTKAMGPISYRRPRRSGLSENCLFQENYIIFWDLENLYTFGRPRRDASNWSTPKHRPLPSMYVVFKTCWQNTDMVLL